MAPPRDFYEIQKRQKRKSLAVLGLLLIVYVGAVGLLLLAVYLMFALPFIGLVSSAAWPKFLLASLLLAGLIAVVHFKDARDNGAGFILKRLSAAPPDPSDRYHLAFHNVVQEIRIAAGLPGVEAYVLPTLATNSLALVKRDGTPCVAVTEGLLADFTRDELEAVVAHELAHIARGDAFILTLVCSLANFFERFRTGIEPDIESDEKGAGPAPGDVGGRSGLLFAAATLAHGVVGLMSFFFSRERELLADAAAVELGRSPGALARAVYKAAVRNSFVGDFSETYAPLFIVAPESHRHSDGRRPSWTKSHPPLEDRLRALAAMAHKSVGEIIDQVDRERRDRSRAIKIISAAPASSSAGPAPDEPRKDWLIETAERTDRGPFSLEELLVLPSFRPTAKITNAAEGVSAKAWDFPQVREGLRRIRQGRPANPDGLGLCPRCRTALAGSFYEGVPVMTCRSCGGKLAHQAEMDRILARREVGFSPELLAEADAFRKAYLLGPERGKKEAVKPGTARLCPNCGYGMRPRPYNYQYVIPVDKCLSCGEIWFDANEIEILQALVERARGD
ncbi:MAG: hypothetical protein FJY82_05020 [Candidatus Aminicenantes bacterium]|nr:hypothetical protein [Candidatus Aminicenantes bacterium]